MDGPLLGSKSTYFSPNILICAFLIGLSHGYVLFVPEVIGLCVVVFASGFFPCVAFFVSFGIDLYL